MQGGGGGGIWEGGVELFQMEIVNKLNCRYVVGRRFTDHAIDFTNRVTDHATDS